MEYEVVYLPVKKVVGLTARTKNSDENMGQIIGGLWYQFYQDGYYDAIENKTNHKSLGIYSDFENDESGEYQVTIACEVSEGKEIPKDAVIKVIPAGKYAKFIVHGHVQKAVAEFWKELWGMDLNRAFQYDFEEYQNTDVENAEIHIFISIL